jgi:hypothetical protein
VKRLLVLAGAAVADVEELPGSVKEAIDAADEVFVVTPRLPSRLEWLMSDTDRATHEADARLDTVLGHLRTQGVEAQGATGADDPEVAIADHVRAFDPDHMLIALRSAEHAAWQERGLLERTASTFAIPMTVFEIDADGSVVSRNASVGTG